MQTHVYGAALRPWTEKYECGGCCAKNVGTPCGGSAKFLPRDLPALPPLDAAHPSTCAVLLRYVVHVLRGG